MPPARNEETLRRRREKYAELAARRPPKPGPKPSTAAEMAAAVETCLDYGGWTWMRRPEVYEGRGRPGKPPLFAHHPLTGRMLWIEVMSTQPGNGPKYKADWRKYLASEGCEIRLVYPATLFEVCAELDPSLSAFTSECGD